MDRETLWTRRTTSTNKPNLTHSIDRENKSDSLSRHFPTSKRAGSETPTRVALPNGASPLNTNITASPGASSAFGLGSGAFASFGSTAKTPKTPGTGFDFGKSSVTTPLEGPDKPSKSAVRPLQNTAASSTRGQHIGTVDLKTPWLLKSSWVMWYRPPTSKNSDYEKSIKPLYKMTTAQEFWKIYSHMKRPSMLPTVSDYHFFKEGIRPVWEDEENKKGGKWIMRLKKGVMDRYWDDLLLAVIGDQFAEAGEEVCGMVVSVRSGEDVLSIWTKNDGGRNIKIRETIKRVLSLPAGTDVLWKSHDDSIAQRSAIDQARQDKGTTEKRRGNGESLNPSRDKSGAPPV